MEDILAKDFAIDRTSTFEFTKFEKTYMKILKKCSSSSLVNFKELVCKI